MTHLPESRSRRTVAALCLIAVMAAVVAWGARTAAADQVAERDIVRAEQDQLIAARSRVVISAAAFAQLTEELASIVDPSFDPGGSDHLVAIERETEVLRTLLDDGRVDSADPSIADLLDASERASAPDAELWAFEELAYVATTPSSTAAYDSVGETALIATVLATSPSLVAVDALSLELDASDTELPATVADYVESTASILATDPGWFGPDLRAPFVGGFLPGELLNETNPALLRSLSDAERLAAVWAYDQWLIARLDTPTPPPVPVLDFAAEALQAQDDMVGTVLDGVDDAIDAQPVVDIGAAYTVTWVIAAVLAAVCATAALVLTVRRTRHLTTAALVDPLTAVGNRRALAALEASWQGNSSPAHGVVAVVDVDRFKMINDTFGHAAGDDVLRQVAAGLERVAEAVAGRRGDGTVVRLGGDEFAIVWSLAQPCSEASVLDAISGVSGQIVVADDAGVDVSLSVGLVSAEQPEDLDGMLAAADLRAYEDKRQRRRETVIIIDEPSAG